MTREKTKQAREEGRTALLPKLLSLGKWAGGILIVGGLAGGGAVAARSYILYGDVGTLFKRYGLLADQFKNVAVLYNIGPDGKVNGINGIPAQGYTVEFFGIQESDMKDFDVIGTFPNQKDLLENKIRQFFALENRENASPDSILDISEVVTPADSQPASLELVTGKYNGNKTILNARVSVNEELTKARARADSLERIKVLEDSLYWARHDSTYKAIGVSNGVLMWVDAEYLNSSKWVVVNQTDLAPDSIKKIPKEIIDIYRKNAEDINRYFKGILSENQYNKFQEYFGKPAMKFAGVHRNDEKLMAQGFGSVVYHKNNDNRIVGTQPLNAFLADPNPKVGGATRHPLANPDFKQRYQSQKSMPRNGK